MMSDSRCADLEGNDVISPRPETVGIEAPELVQHLSELLVGLLTAGKAQKTKALNEVEQRL